MSLPGYVVVEAGPFNGPDDPDASMQWVDISDYVNDNLQLPTAASGRQTDLSTVDPGPFTITLNNNDHRFTPGNPTSPYYPGWRTGMRLRMRETVGSRTFVLADGNLLQPSVTIQVPGADQTVTVTAVDRIGRLQQGRRFISTLAEYVLYHHGTTLRAYWPCQESIPPFGDVSGNGAPPLSVLPGTLGGGPVLSGANEILGQQGGSVPGDDKGVCRITSTLGQISGLDATATSLEMASIYLTQPQPSIPAGRVATLVAWLKTDMPTNPAFVPLGLGTANVSFTIDVDSLGRLSLGATLGLTGTINAGGIPQGRWAPIAIRYGWSPQVFELWYGNSRAVGTLSGSVASDSVAQITAPEYYIGSFGHVQLHIGDPNAFTFTDFVNQQDPGRVGLVGQYAGDRVRTIALYAGMPSGELTNIDQGQSMMSQASLAGRAPLDGMRDAETTEQGLLHARGRTLVFHDRARRYNR